MRESDKRDDLILPVVGILSQFMHAPRVSQLLTANRVVSILKGT